MDTADLTRAVIGVPAAAITPPFISWLRGRVARPALTAALGAWAVAPSLGRWEGWVLIAAAVLVTIIFGTSPGRDAPLRAAAAAVVLAAAAGLVLDAAATIDALDGAASDDAPVVVVAGALITVFVGGAVIGQFLGVFAHRVTTADSDELARAGLYIGWLERALLYGFVVAGAPSAVALVVAAKSIARFPSFSKEKFAEYFLIGTLASVVVAVGAGVAVRAILGLSPVLS